jgi:ribonuclease PH
MKMFDKNGKINEEKLAELLEVAKKQLTRN